MIHTCSFFFFFLHFFPSAKPSRGHWWCRGSHINPDQPHGGGTDTSLHLPESPISGRLNKLQLIGSWRQTRQAHFIAVWRQPFPSVACWVLKSGRCLMSDVWPGWTTWLPCCEKKQRFARGSVFKRCCMWNILVLHLNYFSLSMTLTFTLHGLESKPIRKCADFTTSPSRRGATLPLSTGWSLKPKSWHLWCTLPRTLSIRKW